MRSPSSVLCRMDPSSSPPKPTYHRSTLISLWQRRTRTRRFPLPPSNSSFLKSYQICSCLSSRDPPFQATIPARGRRTPRFDLMFKSRVNPDSRRIARGMKSPRATFDTLEQSADRASDTAEGFRDMYAWPSNL